MFKICKLNIVGIIAAFIFIAATAAVSFAQGVEGKVRDQKGKGIANAVITLRLDGKDIKTGKTDSKGKFRISGVKPGSYNLLVEADGYSSGLKTAVEIKDKMRDLGDNLILRVDPGTMIIINGSVFFREGTSLSGAKVEVEEVRSDGTVKKLGTYYTTIRGEFTHRMSEKTSKIRVTAKFKGITGIKEIDVDNAAIYRTAITLDISRNDR